MNSLTSARLLAWTLFGLLSFGISNNLNAQCDDFVSFPMYDTPVGSPVATEINITLNASGVRNLTNAILNAAGFVKNAGCDYYLTQTPADAGSWDPTPVQFNCSDVATSPQVWYLRVDGNTPGTNGGPSSNMRTLHINVSDNINPMISCPASVVTNADAGMCTAALGPYSPASVSDNCSQMTTYTITGSTMGSGSTMVPAMNFNVGVSTVTFTAEDPSGNTATCAFSVTVNDMEAPMITCPTVAASYNNDPGVCYATLDFAVSATDNCNMNPAITWTAPGAVPASGAGSLVDVQFPLGTTTLTFEANDGAAVANTATCAVMITVVDNEMPMISCPPNTTVNADASCMYTVAGTAWNATASDNCPPLAMLTHDYNGGGTTLNGEMFSEGTTSVTWEAEDNTGNTASCSFSVTVVDVTPPMVTLNASYSASVTPGDCSKVLTINMPENGTPAATDNCTAPASIVLALDSVVINGNNTPGFFSGSGWSPSSGGPLTWQFPSGTTIVYFSWTDLAGNYTVGTITVDIDENENPVAVCKPLNTLVLPIGASGSVTFDPSFVDNGSSDNCPDLMLSTAPSGFDCGSVGLQVVTLTATDAAGNTSTCTTNINVVDNIAPDVICPASFTISANSGCGASGVTGGNIALGTFGSLGSGQFADNCGVTAVTWSLTGATMASSPATGLNTDLSAVLFNSGTTTVTYTVKDAAGNQKACNFSINVTDLTGPVFDTSNPGTPANGEVITITASLSGCLAQYTWVDPTVSDACSPPATILSQTHFSGGFFPFGMTTVTYLAKDAVGNISTYTFKINVVDNQAPNPDCQNITVALNGAGLVTVNPADVDDNSTDNCFFSYSSSPVTYDCGDLGDNNYTLVLVDGSGNSSSCTAVVTVEDNIAPSANCTAITEVNLNPAGTASLSAAALNNASTDNCPGSLTYEISLDGGAFASSVDFDCSHLGVHTVTLLVTDGGSNTSTCTRSITVKDITPPSFTVPANTTISCDASSLPADTGEPTNISDACDSDPVVSFTQTFLPGACANEFTIQRRWTVTDASGNSSLQTQSIVVEDNNAPTFSMVSSITIETNDPALCDAPLTMEVGIDSLMDNCAGFVDLTITYTIDYPTPSFGYTDQLMPVMGTSIPSTTWPIGTTVVTWRAEDECGNISSHVVNITVLDTQAPVFTNGYENICGEAYVLPNTTGACSNLFTWQRPNFLFDHVEDCLDFTVDETISDPTVQQAINLTNAYDYDATFSFQAFPSAQFPVGVTTVTYTAEDDQGNISTCAFTVEVQDIEAPVLTCPPNQVFSATCPDAQIQDYRNLVNISDNCSGDVTLTQTWAPGTTLGTIFAPNPPAADSVFTVVITGEDAYNASSCSFTVTLADGDAPIPTVAQLPDIVDSCGFYIVFAPTATDACNPSAPIIYGTPSAPVGTFLPGTPPRYKLLPGNYVITWVYNDGNGNVSSQPQNITVLADTFAPVALCKPGFTIDLDGLTGQASINVNQIDNGSYDMNDCGSITVAISQGAFDCDDLGVNTITLTVTDTSGNTSTCNTTVTVRDVTPPVFAPLQPNDVVEACDTLPAFVFPMVSDVCDQNVTLVADTLSTQDTSGYGLYNYLITLTYTATDDSGNSSTAVRFVSVLDTQAPVFSPDAPDTIIVYTDANALVCSDTALVDLTPFISDCATGDDLAVTNTAFPLGGADATGIYDLGTHDVYFIAEDVTGNLSVDTVTVIIRDGTAPVAVCINGVSAALQPSGSVTVTYAQFDNNSFDNCTVDDSLLLQIQRLDLDSLLAPSASVSFDCSDADGTTQHPIKLFVTDQAGNMSMCETYIVIQDNVFPTITSCPPNAVVQCTDDLSPATQGTATATDNCTVASIAFTDEFANGVDTICQVLTRTWQVFDQANNLTTCVQVLSIQDTIAPVFSQLPPDDTISCSEVLGAPLVLTATDNCTMDVPVTFVQDTIDIAAGLCGKYNYTVRRTWTATDDCNNSTTHSRNITVTDTEVTLFLGMPDTVNVFSSNFPPSTNCTVPVDINIAQFLSDCAPVDELTVTNDAPLGDTSLNVVGNYMVGTYVIHFSATDPCGNTGVDSIVLNVIDNSVPTAICNGDVVISLGTNGTAQLSPNDVNLGSTDNCMIDTMFLSQSIFDCGELGLNSVTLTVVDQAGNMNTCTVDVEVELGPTAGFNLALTGSTVSVFGAADGTASADATGGSGNFSYEWETGSTNPMISGLVAGFYTVTVTDDDTGCERIDSVEVLEGLKLKLTVGMATGSQGQIVSVPVTVENFIDIYGFSFSAAVDLASVGTVIGISTVEPTIAPTLVDNVVTGTLSILWADPNQNPLTLPDSTILFYIDVELDANAPVGSMSDVNILDAPVIIDFLQDQSGQPVSTMVDIMNGKVTIDNVSNDLVLAGDIQTWANPEVMGSVEKPVANVDVALTGGLSANFLTDVTGMYDFMVAGGVNTVTSASKDTPGNAGITAGDLLRIVNHIFGDTLTSPYQWVAADVNNSLTISLADYLLIQRVVLGTDLHLQTAPDWKFIPKSYVFPSNDTPMFGPLTNPIPETIEHTPVTMSFLDDDFVAVRMGDVNGNTPVSANDDSNDRTGDRETLYFNLMDMPVQAGQTISVPFMANEFKGRQSYQMTLVFDPEVLELSQIEMGALPKLEESNFGTAHLENGYLTTVWVSLDPVSMKDGEVLFTLHFRATGSSNALSSVLKAGSQITKAEAYTLDGETMDVDLRYEQSALGSDVFALYQNTPNPFYNQTTISFRLPESGRATLRVFNTAGQLVKLHTATYDKGYNQIQLQKGDFGAPGVYWYELETATNSDRKKMILID